MIWVQDLGVLENLKKGIMEKGIPADRADAYVACFQIGLLKLVLEIPDEDIIINLDDYEKGKALGAKASAKCVGVLQKKK